MMKRFFLSILLGGCLLTNLHAVDIHVRDQQSFDRLDSDLKEALSTSPERVDVHFAPGVYYYRDRHLYLKEIRAEGTVIALHGDNAVLYPSMERVDRFDPMSSYFVETPGGLLLVRREDPIRMAGFLVRIVDKENGICRLKVDREVPQEAVDNAYIYLTEWYRGRTYKIVKTEGKSIYFYVDDLKQRRFLYNVNLDFTFSLQFPRYRLIHCGLSEPEDGALCSTATSFLVVDHSQLGGLTCSDITFIGNRYDEKRPEAGLITYDHSVSPGGFSHCFFEGVRSDCFLFFSTNGVVVEDCTFQGNYRHCLKTEQDCADIRFCRNSVKDSGLCGDNVYAVFCTGTDFLVQDNEIADFGYGGIYTGLYYATDKNHRISGLVSRNELFQTPAYFASAPDRLLMDSGAIYIATQNDDVRIEDNYIHDINGPTYNRGIFADDGTSNVVIRRNRIENVKNHFALDIDPRSAWKMLRRKERKVNYVHENVVVEDNEVSGRVRVPKK